MKMQTELGNKLLSESTSALHKYMYVTLGKKSIFCLVKYELVQLFLVSLPGVIGLFLRRVFYKYFLGRVGRNVTFGRNIVIRHPHKICIGDNVIVDDNCVLDAKSNNTGITIGSNVLIGRNTILSCKGGSIEIGNNTNIGINCLFHSQNSLKVGDNTLFAAYCYLVAGGSHDFGKIDIPVIQKPYVSKGGIIVENNVWSGAGVIVLDGVRIGQNSILAAGAVINSNVPESVIVGGVPGKIIKERNNSY